MSVNVLLEVTQLLSEWTRLLLPGTMSWGQSQRREQQRPCCEWLGGPSDLSPSGGKGGCTEDNGLLPDGWRLRAGSPPGLGLL